MDGIDTEEEPITLTDLFKPQPLSEEDKQRIQTENEQAVRYKCVQCITDVLVIKNPYEMNLGNYIAQQAEVIRKYVMNDK